MLQLQIIGNLTKDAEVKESKQTGTAFLTFTVAVNRGKDKPATFIRCMQRSSSYTDNVRPYLLKGKKVFVQGAIDVGVFINTDRQAAADITCFVDRIELLSPNDSANNSDTTTEGIPDAVETPTQSTPQVIYQHPKAEQTQAVPEDNGSDLPF